MLSEKPEGHFDVIVAGGGPAGIAAAAGAARLGARTLLIERYGFLGGGATAMLVNPFMTYHAGGQQIIRGIFQEMIDRMKQLGGYGSPKQPTAFDPEAFKFAADRLLVESGVTLLFHAWLAGATVTGVEPGSEVAVGSRIDELQVAVKTGISRLSAQVYVDSTGDADLAALAGAVIEKGRPQDGLAQPMTLNFRMANVDVDRMPSREEITKRYLAARERGEISCPREDVLYFFTTHPGTVHFNTTRVIKRDATDSWELTRAELEARKQVWELVGFLVREIPGFENAYLEMTGTQIGVRESRRVIGEYILTGDDCVGARKFPDAVARGSYPIDIHNPAGSGTVIKGLPPGEWYDIPYRCLVPLKVENLLVGGRPISCTHEAHSSLRVMPIAMATGHAAGVAAALAAKRGVPPRKLDVREVQKALIEQGASIEVRENGGA